MRENTKTKHPWQLWLDGNEHIHEPTNVKSFRNYLYAYAQRNNVWVKAKIDGNKVRFRFYASEAEHTLATRLSTRTSDGQFIEQLDPAPLGYCEYPGCGKALTPSAHGFTTCHRMDWSIAAPVSLHQEIAKES